MLSASDKITAFAVLDRENAQFIGYRSGKVELIDTSLNKQYSNTDLRLPLLAQITTISTYASEKIPSGEKALHTIVVIGDTAGHVYKLSIKRSTQVNGGLKCAIITKPNTAHSKISSSAILSDDIFAIGHGNGIDIYIGKKSTHVSSNEPVALLPIIDTNDIVAIYGNGSTQTFAANNKKSSAFPNQISTANITAIDGLITKEKLGKYCYTLAILDSAGKLTLKTDQTEKQIAINVTTMTISVGATQSIIAYIANNELFLATYIPAAKDLRTKYLGNVDPTSVLAFDLKSFGVYAATDKLQLLSTNVAASSAASGPLVDFGPPPLTTSVPVPAAATPFSPHSSMPNPPPQTYATVPQLSAANMRPHANTTPSGSSSSLPVSQDPSSHYQSIPVSNSQQRILRIVTSSTNHQFLMSSKASIAEAGASGAKLVLCEHLPDNKLAVAKKFKSWETLQKELTVDIKGTMRGVVNNYGWVKVNARKGGIETAEKKYYLFLKYMEQGNGERLRDFLLAPNIDIIQKCEILLPLVNDIIAGLKSTFHNQSKYHLDIKPKNIALDYKTKQNNTTMPAYTAVDLLNKQLEAKLLDFGESIEAADGFIRFGAGDSRFMSWQRIAVYRILHMCGISAFSEDPQREYYLGAAEDAWALGVTILELLFGSNPFAVGRKDNAGIDAEILQTRIYAFFQQAIASFMTHPFFSQSERFNTPAANTLRKYIINLVHMDEQRREIYLKTIGSASSSAYTTLPTKPPEQRSMERVG